MRNLLMLLLFSWYVGLAAGSLRTSELHAHLAVPQDDTQEVLRGFVEILPLMQGVDVKFQKEGDAYTCKLQNSGITMTLVAYKSPGKLPYRLAVLMSDISVATFLKGLGNTDLDLIQLVQPVAIFAPDISGVEKVELSSLPKIVSDAVKSSADVLYLRKGVTLLSRIEASKSLGEGIDLLKTVGIDLDQLVVQIHVVSKSNSDILLRRKGVWSNPFGLKNSSITDATVRVSKKTGAKGTSNQATATKNLAIWGKATIGTSEVFLYGERSTKGGRPNGDAYALDGKQVTLQTIVDLANAMPGNPFPTSALSILPLDKVQIKNPAYVDDPTGDDPSDPSKFLAYINTIIPDGVPTGPKLIARGEASVLGYSMANLAVDASAKEFSASGDVKNFKLGDLNMGPSGAFEITTAGKDPQMSVSGKISAWGLTNQSVKVFIDKSQFKCSTTYGIKNVGDATLTAKTGNNYSLPWSVNVDVSGLAGKIFDAGIDAYNAGVADLKKLGVPVVEPKDVAEAVMHADNLAKEQTWVDLGENASTLFTSSDPWEKMVRNAQIGKAFRDPKHTIAVATEAGRQLLSTATGLASSAGDGAKKFFNKIGDGFKKIGKLFRHGGGHKKEEKAPPYDPSKILWNGIHRANIAYHKTVTASSEVKTSEENPFHPGHYIPRGNKEFAVDAEDNPPEYLGQTNFFSKEEPFPWIELDLGQSYHVETIIIQVPEDIAPNGLQGAVVAAATFSGDHLMASANKHVQFYIKEKGSTIVISPSSRKSGYAAKRDEVEQRAKELGMAELAIAFNASHDPITIGKLEDAKKAAEKAYRESYIKLAQYMDDIRYIRIFVPRKAKLAITEIRVTELPQLSEEYLFVD